MYTWGVNSTGYIDPTGVDAGNYFSRIISWYTKGGFVDELGVKHVSNYSYAWKYWEVLNEVDAGSSGTHALAVLLNRIYIWKQACRECAGSSEPWACFVATLRIAN